MNWFEFVKKVPEKIGTARSRPFGTASYYENKGSLTLYGLIVE